MAPTFLNEYQCLNRQFMVGLSQKLCISATPELVRFLDAQFFNWYGDKNVITFCYTDG